MKNQILATTLSLTLLGASGLATATETKTELKAAGAFTTSALVGAAAGGPIGMFFGALGGAYVSHQIEKADQAKLTELELTEYKMQLAELRTQLASADSKVGELVQLAMDKLEFQVLFHTGADQLTERGKARVAALANFLQQHPGLSVRLTGHADPRGTDEYNNVLSDHRAISVEHLLIASGIEADRINRRAYGSLQSMATKGNYEAYAMERRVDIEIYNPVIANTVAQAH